MFPVKSSIFNYVWIGNYMLVKTSGAASELANARPPGSTKFANAPPPGTDKAFECPEVARGMGAAGID